MLQRVAATAEHVDAGRQTDRQTEFTCSVTSVDFSVTGNRRHRSN